jgi:hypothetical protein
MKVRRRGGGSSGLGRGKSWEKDRKQDGWQVIEESLLKMKNTFNEECE